MKRRRKKNNEETQRYSCCGRHNPHYSDCDMSEYVGPTETREFPINDPAKLRMAWRVHGTAFVDVETGNIFTPLEARNKYPDFLLRLLELKQRRVRIA